jgi:hypothetical protein
MALRNILEQLKKGAGNLARGVNDAIIPGKDTLTGVIRQDYQRQLANPFMGTVWRDVVNPMVNATVRTPINTVTDAGRFLGNAAQMKVTPYSSFQSPISRLAYQGVGMMDPNVRRMAGINTDPSEALSNFGGLMNTAVSFGTLGSAGGLTSMPTRGLLSRVGTTAKIGALEGGMMNAAQSLEANRGASLPYMAQQAAYGGAAGSLFGGAAGAAAPVLDPLVRGGANIAIKGGKLAGRGIAAAGKGAYKGLAMAADEADRLNTLISRFGNAKVPFQVAPTKIAKSKEVVYPSQIKDLYYQLRDGKKIPPVTVVKKGDGYQIVKGLDSYEAHTMLGSKTVPVVEIDAKTQQAIDRQFGRDALGRFAAANSENFAAAPFGMAAGFEQDEQGNMSYNAEAGLAGAGAAFAGTFAGKSALGFKGAKNTFKGISDSKSRFEIPDNAARVIGKLTGTKKLAEVFDHPELFKNYPDFKNIKIQANGKVAGASWDLNTRTLSVNPSIAKDPHTLRQAIVHELQHAVQQREGFAIGATPQPKTLIERLGFPSKRMEDQYRRNPAEIEAYDVESRMDMTPEQRSSTTPYSSQAQYTENIAPATNHRNLLNRQEKQAYNDDMPILNRDPDPLDAIKQEARKYKSAEEFYNALADPRTTFEILPNSYLKKPKKLYRGVSSEGSGTGSGVEGLGLYTTTDKKTAMGYAKNGGRLMEMNPETDIPSNPIYFRGPAEVRSWVDKVSRKLGMRTSEFNEKIGVNRLVNSLGHNGVAFDLGNGVAYAKYPESASNITDLYNEANQGGGGNGVRILKRETPKTNPIQAAKERLDNMIAERRATAESNAAIRQSLPISDQELSRLQRLQAKNPAGDIETLRRKDPDLMRRIGNETPMDMSEEQFVEQLLNTPRPSETKYRSTKEITDLRKYIADENKSARERLKASKYEQQILEEEFGRVATPAEQERIFREWERSIQQETITTRQWNREKEQYFRNINEDDPLFRDTITKNQFQAKRSANTRAQNTARSRFNSEQARTDPTTKQGVKVKIKPGVTDSDAGFPSRILSTAPAKDKQSFLYQRESLLRNLEDTFGRGTPEGKQMRDYLYEPVVRNETERTNFTNTIRRNFSELASKSGIKRSSKEDFAAADFIEGTIKEDQLRKQFGPKSDGILQMVEEGRRVYKDLLTRTNAELTKYGYDPIPERSNYVTHTRQIQTLADQVGSLLNVAKEKLPTAISSINVNTKPGKRFNRFALRREGGSTHEGLMTSMDKYLDISTQQIFHTADVQRTRQVQNYLQEQASSADNGTDRLSNFADYIGQYADHLAGKQNIIDRPFEKVFGRGVLKAGDWLRGRFGANAVGGSLSSAITNFIPLTQGLATTNKIAVAKGLLSNVSSAIDDVAKIDGLESSFLRRRFPEQRIGSNAKTVVRDVVTSPFSLADAFTSRTIVASKFYEGVQKGLDPQSAMSQADEYAARLMSDRSLGQSPLLFNSKILGAFTQFQNEVNNQVSFLAKDLPAYANGNKAKLASMLTQVAVYSYLYNAAYETMIGRRPAVDPIDYLTTAISQLSAGDIAGMFDVTDEDSTAGKIVNALPGSSILTGGRIPLSGAIPKDLSLKELSRPLTHLALPYGGGQVRKTIEGLSAYNQGGDYASDGDEKFAIEQSPANLARSALFGKWSTPESQEYIQGMGKTAQPSGKTEPITGQLTSTRQGSLARTRQEQEVKARLSDLDKEEKQLLRGNEGFFGIGGMDDSERESRLSQIEAERTQITRQKKVIEFEDKFEKVNGKQSTSSLTRSLNDKSKKELTKDVYKAYLNGEIDDQSAGKLLNKMGIKDITVIEDDLAAGLPTSEQADYVWEQLQSGREIGSLIETDLMTNAVADDLFDKGHISEGEWRGLKAAIKGGSKTRSSRAGSRKAITISAPSTGKFAASFQNARRQGTKAPTFKIAPPPEVKLTLK